jgi:uncharacterized protein with HEPN domain
MNLSNKDIDIVEHILEYCNEINETKSRFGETFEDFNKDFVYRNASAMCILQIGELAGHLSDDFKLNFSAIPWKSIKNMRNLFAHNYGSIDVLLTWETITQDIPNLKNYCEGILKNK